jgi:hypothetical protein
MIFPRMAGGIRNAAGLPLHPWMSRHSIQGEANHETHQSPRRRAGGSIRGEHRGRANQQPGAGQLSGHASAGNDTICPARDARRTANARYIPAVLHARHRQSTVLAESDRLVAIWRIHDHRAERPPAGAASDRTGKRSVLAAAASAVSAWDDVTAGRAVSARRRNAAAARGVPSKPHRDDAQMTHRDPAVPALAGGEGAGERKETSWRCQVVGPISGRSGAPVATRS